MSNIAEKPEALTPETNSGDEVKLYTNDSTVHKFLGMSGNTLSRAVSLMAGAGFLLFGYDQGVMGSLLTLDDFRHTFEEIDTTEYPDKATYQGFVIAIYEIGCLVGALSTMYLGDKLGRRKMIVLGCIIMTIGAIIQCASYSVGQLIAGRIITGIGNGMNTSTVPVWQSECAKPEKRGKLVMLQGALISGGIMISYWIDFGFYFADGPVSWRFPVAFQIIFPLFIGPFIMYLPESPRWLLKVGKIDEAVKVFSALDGVPANDPTIVAEVSEIEEAIAIERAGEQKGMWKQICTQGEAKTFHRVMLGAWNQVMQQITGINLITYYAGTIFENYIGMSALNSRILAACNGTEYFLASWIAYYTIERFGRRKLMLFGCLGQSFSMAILTGCNWAANRGNSGAGIAAAVFLFVFNSVFSIGWLGMTWLYPAEITPLNVRAAANGLSTASNWIFNFMVVMITPVAFNNIGPYTYTIFAAINLAMFPAVYFFYPETAGRSLEEMDKIFALSNVWTPWDVVKIARDMPHDYQNGKFVEQKAVTEHDERPIIQS